MKTRDNDNSTRYRRWMVRQPMIVRGAVYAFIAPLYVFRGLVSGFRDGVMRYLEDRDAIENLAYRRWLDRQTHDHS